MGKFVAIADACELVTDGTHYTPKNVGVGIPFLTVKDVTDSELDFSGCSYISEEDYESADSGNSAPKLGDVLFSKDGTVGKVHVVSTDKPFAVLSSLAILRPKNGLVDPQYLGHVLRSPAAIDQALKKKTGSAIRRIILSDLKKVRLPLPSLPEQRRIAAILDQADVLRAKRREALAQLDRLTQSIFIEMFGDPSTNPKGWPKKQLAKLIAEGDTINYGVVQPGDEVDEGVPLVRVGDLIDGRVRHDFLKRIDPAIESAYKRSRLRGDEILVSCVGSIGVVAMATEAEKGFNIARAVARIRPSAFADRTYLAAHLQAKSVQRYFTNELRTVSQPTLNIKQLAETEIMCPPLKLQTEFAKRMVTVNAIKAAESRATNELESLFSSLQHRAFRGELFSSDGERSINVMPPATARSTWSLDTEKGLEALLYSASRLRTRTLYFPLKALYLADKHHIRIHCRTIYGESHKALPMGPVPAFAYDAVERLKQAAAPGLFPDDPLRAALRREGNQLISLRTAQMDKFSADEIASLDHAIQKCSSMTLDELKNHSHDAAYNKTPKNQVIQFEDILDMVAEE